MVGVELKLSFHLALSIYLKDISQVTFTTRALILARMLSYYELSLISNNNTHHLEQAISEHDTYFFLKDSSTLEIIENS